MDGNIGIYILIGAVVLFLSYRAIANRKASPALVREKIGSGALVVDVRTPGEYRSGSYPKARNIPLDALSARMGELPKDKPIILFCASGSRSGQAARLLKRAGFGDVLSAGGLADMPR
jgi:phage shock protein E